MILLKNCDFYDGEKFKKGNIYIKNNKIYKIIPNQEIFDVREEKEVFDASRYFVIPGMINTHSHIPMTLMRGIADNLNLQNWLFNVIFPVEERFIDDDFIYFGTVLGLIEMIKGGITTSVEMYYLPQIMAKTFKKMNFRGYIGIGYGDGLEKSLANAEEFILKYKDDALINPSPFAHAIYTVNEENLLWVRDISKKHNLSYQFHLLETKNENSDFFKKKNINLLEYLENLGFLSEKLIAAHSVWLTDEDIEILKRNNVTVSHNPSSNLKLDSGIMRLKDLFENNVNVTLGTDGAASNNALSLFFEMNLAAKLHHIKYDAPVNVEKIFDTVTENAGLSLNKSLGKIQEGGYADLVFIKKEHYSMLPGFNPVSNFVYSMPSDAVEHVMINGVFVLKDKRFTVINEYDFYKELNSYLAKIKISDFLKNKI